MTNRALLSLDQGTTSSRALVMRPTGEVLAMAQSELTQHYPEPGWVEHDPMEIWQGTLDMCRQVLQQTQDIQIAAIGITNQRETTIIWDRQTGEPVYPAIVWQDRRTTEFCKKLKQQNREGLIHRRTGLLLDPYFSASKINWILDAVPGARQRAEAGDLAFGTVDCWLIWNLTGGRVHATDATNAARTSLFNLETQSWDDALLALFNVPAALLPEVKDCADDYGVTDKALLGQSIAIAGVAGDQQAASFGQACFTPGMMKSTYGTGCFALVNTGAKQVVSQNRLLATIAYRLGGETVYALEGSIFMAGAILQWLRDGINLFASTPESEMLAQQARQDNRVVMVPAFTGLGAPHWVPDAQAAIFGLTRDTGRAEIAHAALQSVSLQTRDLLEAMSMDMGGVSLTSPTRLRVDGGMAKNNWFLQNLTDITGRPIDRPLVVETTALGAAYLAGLQAGFYNGLDEIAENWQLEKAFDPQMNEADRDVIYTRWQAAVHKVID